MCLEEMLKIPCGGIATGALFYGRPRSREQVVIDDSLRTKTEALAQETHELHAAGKTPKAKYIRKKCDPCSLVSQCLPKTTGINKDVQGYLRKALEF